MAAVAETQRRKDFGNDRRHGLGRGGRSLCRMVELLAGSPLLLLFTVAALGFLIGRVEIGGFGLGVSAVLFVGLGVGSIDPSLRLPDFVVLFGLVTFVYVIGLTSAPGFFASLRRRGLQAALLAAGAVALAAGLVAVIGPWLGLPAPTLAGIFAGASTNTPALAAVIDALGEADAATGPVVGYSLTYPFGVLGVLAVIALAPRLLRVDLAKEVVSPEDAPGVGTPIETRTLLIDRELPEMSVGFLRERLGLRVAFGRMRRDGRVAVVTDAVVLHRGDLVSLVGEPTALEEASLRLGTVVDEHLELDRSVVDFRRIVVSRAGVAQRPLRELHLDERFGAVVTRLRRGDVELVPTDDTHLELGDAVRVVAPREQLAAVSSFLGDSHRALAEIDVISFSLGIGLGLVLGQLPIPLPGGGTFTLGLAGGPLIAGLVLGRIGRTGRLVWTLPYAASLTLRQVGLVLFLAGVGTRSGWAFAQAVREGHVLPVVGLGVLVTVMVALVTLFVGHKLLRFPAGVVVGMIAGIQTQPADLAFAMERTRNEVPSAGYAAVYPVATVMKIVLAQLLLRV
jgi:putative transport protein